MSTEAPSLFTLAPFHLGPAVKLLMLASVRVPVFQPSWVCVRGSWCWTCTSDCSQWRRGRHRNGPVVSPEP